MKERFADVATPSGRMEAFITHPEEGGPFPAVIVYMDVFGLREELFDVARRVATVGYYAMVPDFYYRNGRLRVSLLRVSGRRSARADRDHRQARRGFRPRAGAIPLQSTHGRRPRLWPARAQRPSQAGRQP
jgi:dienelactone hydrolase